MSIELLFKIADTLETDPNTILGVKNNVASVDEALNELPLEMKYHLGTFVFRGFFMPEYCFLRRYSSKVSAFFAKFLLYFSRCTRSELLCRCHSFRLKSQDFSGLCSRRYIRAFPTICRCQRQTIPHRLRRKIQAYRIWKSLCSTAFATLFSKTCFRADEIVPLGLQLNLKIA